MLKGDSSVENSPTDQMDNPKYPEVVRDTIQNVPDSILPDVVEAVNNYLKSENKDNNDSAPVNIYTVAELLRKLNRYEVPSHNLDLFAEILEKNNFGLKVKRFIGAGGENIVLELEDGNVLKMCLGTDIPDDWGKRPFDCPVINSGSISAEVANMDWPDWSVRWYIQPFADTNVSFEETRKFIDEKITAQGYIDLDIGYEGQKQLGYITGENGEKRLVLLDYQSVYKDKTMDKPSALQV